MLPRREGQPIFMRGEVGIRDDGQFRPLVAHNTTHIDMPVHFLDGGADLHDVLNNPAYRVNLPLLARVVDVSVWPDPQYCYESHGVRYCELVTAEMLPPPLRVVGAAPRAPGSSGRYSTGHFHAGAPDWPDIAPN